jgi:hypothetical protein
VLRILLAGRQFGFDGERAVYLTVLHRLMVSRSDRHADVAIETSDVVRRVDAIPLQVGIEPPDQRADTLLRDALGDRTLWCLPLQALDAVLLIGGDFAPERQAGVEAQVRNRCEYRIRRGLAEVDPADDPALITRVADP